MAQNKLQKLELTWIGKDEERKAIEPRILIENPKYSYGDTESGNMLIHGDNLLALKALEQDYSGRVKCIYIDPPYNTGNAFEHYDDGLEHSIWLSLMRDRLQILWKLLSKEGSIWISIDDDEYAYLKVLCDECFGRNCFIATNIWQKRYSRENREAIGDVHEYIVVYAKDPSKFKETRHKLPMNEQQAKIYKNPNNDPKGRWRGIPLTAQSGHATSEQFYEIIAPNGTVHRPSNGRCWGIAKATFEKYLSEKRIYWGKDGCSQPSYIRYLSEVDGVAPWTWWPSEEVSHTDAAKKESYALFGKQNVFDTPKPEALLERIIHIATNEEDLVLDSFLGSGTTAAVAQKMGRKYIGVELGDQAYSFCYPRLKMVTDGTDQGGISKAQNWKGGSGFKFYELAPSLLKHDKFGNLIINKEYNADMLAAAMAKQEGYTYQPDASLYWKQGQSSEHDYIYTTTQFLTVESLDAISETMTEDESLLICCTSFQNACTTHHPRITVKKIPQMLLGRCEFNKDDYSLNIIDMPQLNLEEDDDFIEEEVTDEEPPVKEKKPIQGTLFD